jgi:hypothetical protein
MIPFLLGCREVSNSDLSELDSSTYASSFVSLALSLSQTPIRFVSEGIVRLTLRASFSLALSLSQDPHSLRSQG